MLKAEDFFRDPQAGFDRVTDFLGLDRRALTDHVRHNAPEYRPMTPETRAWLRDHFRPHDDRLRELVGFGFDGA